MGKVHVRRVTLTAFRAFQDKQSSPVLPTTGLVGIRGRDLTTGVSSGSGKSTIPLAIAYAFGFCPFPATEQQNLYVNTPMQVELELETDTGLAILRRGKEFSLTHNGKVTQGSAKAVEDEIRKMVGLPTDLLEALSYRQQQERGRFLSMTDQEKKSFLGTLLGAEELETQIADSIKKSNALQVEVDQIVAVVAALKAQHSKPEEPKMEEIPKVKLLALPKPHDPRALGVLKAALKECEARITKKKSEIVGTRTSDTLIREHAIKTAMLNAYHKSQYGFDALKREEQAMSDGVCPTCAGPWLDEAKLGRIQAQIVTLEPAIAKIPALTKEVADLEGRYKQALADEANQTEAQNQLTKLRDVERDLLTSMEEENHLIREAQRTIEGVQLENQRQQQAAEWAEATNARLRNAYSAAFQAWFKADIEIAKRESELWEKQKLVTEEADYAAALKSYLGSLFDEVLAQISSETNELLRGVPNTPTTTVTFTSEGVTAKGVTRQEIKPVVLKNGRQVSLKSGISGGQLESVELAVDLSITKVIGQRTGVRPGFMIFDESFSAHCMTTKEACLQVLKQAAQDCLILVVDHATELKDYFDQFIDIEAERDVSRFAISG